MTGAPAICKVAKNNKTQSQKQSQVTFSADFTFKRVQLWAVIRTSVSQKWRIQLVPLWSDLKESRIARRSEARRYPLTRMCHSCERPLQQNGQMVGVKKVKLSSDIIRGMFNISKRTTIFVTVKVTNKAVLN